MMTILEIKTVKHYTRLLREAQQQPSVALAHYTHTLREAQAMITTNLQARIQIGITDEDCLDVLQPIRISMGIGGATFQDYLSPLQALQLADELTEAANKWSERN